jgi:hypothetical protein
MHTHQRTHYIRTHIDAPDLLPVELNRDSTAYENFSLRGHTVNYHSTNISMFMSITGGIILVLAAIYFSKKIRKNFK